MANTTIGLSDELRGIRHQGRHTGTRSSPGCARRPPNFPSTACRSRQKGAFLAMLVELTRARVHRDRHLHGLLLHRRRPRAARGRADCLLRRLRGVDLAGQEVLGRGRGGGQDRPARRARCRDARAGCSRTVSKRPTTSRSSTPTRPATTGTTAAAAARAARRPDRLRQHPVGRRGAGAGRQGRGRAPSRRSTRRLADDERITLCLLPVADGVTLARRR